MTAPPTAAAALAASMSEDDLLACVLDAAKALSRKTAHFRPAKTSKGWRTAVSGDGKGFPDLVMAHGRQKRLLFVELKSETGKPTLEQLQWLTLFSIFEGRRSIGTHLWRPSDWLNGTIMRVLEGVE